MAEPLLVAQPSYAGIRDSDVPALQHAEELVCDQLTATKNRDGVWVWHRVRTQPESDELHRRVGRCPTPAGIVPWVRPAQIRRVTVPPRGRGRAT